MSILRSIAHWCVYLFALVFIAGPSGNGDDPENLASKDELNSVKAFLARFGFDGLP